MTNIRMKGDKRGERPRLNAGFTVGVENVGKYEGSDISKRNTLKRKSNPSKTGGHYTER